MSCDKKYMDEDGDVGAGIDSKFFKDKAGYNPTVGSNMFLVGLSGMVGGGAIQEAFRRAGIPLETHAKPQEDKLYNTTKTEDGTVVLVVGVAEKRTLILAVVLFTLLFSIKDVKDKRQRKKLYRLLKKYIATYKSKVIEIKGGGETFIKFLDISSDIKSLALSRMTIEESDEVKTYICPTTLLSHINSKEPDMIKDIVGKDKQIFDEYLAAESTASLGYYARMYGNRLLNIINQNITDGEIVYKPVV